MQSASQSSVESCGECREGVMVEDHSRPGEKVCVHCRRRVFDQSLKQQMRMLPRTDNEVIVLKGEEALQTICQLPETISQQTRSGNRCLTLVSDISRNDGREIARCAGPIVFTHQGWIMNSRCDKCGQTYLVLDKRKAN